MFIVNRAGNMKRFLNCSSKMVSSMSMRNYHQQITPFASLTVKVPTLGESISDGEIGSWFKKEGDFCKEDEVIVALDTDKVQAEVKAPQSGVITKILVPKIGEKVEIGRDLFIIDTDASAPSSSSSDASKPATTQSSESKAAASTPTTTTTTTPSSSAHKREPMIKFRYGKRDEIEQAKPQETKPQPTIPQPKPVAPAAPTVRGSVLVYSSASDLPAQYRRKKISQKEMDAIYYGGEVAIPEVKPKKK